VEELQQCQGERDEALLLQSALQRSVEELQSASQTSTHTGVDIAHATKIIHPHDADSIFALNFSFILPMKCHRKTN
jgi:hypothetical protein